MLERNLFASWARGVMEANFFKICSGVNIQYCAILRYLPR